MNTINNNHLTEEQLMDAASGIETDAVRAHIDSCGQCADEIRELKTVAEKLVNIDDEEVPSSVERRIFHSLHRNKPTIVRLLENPMLSVIIAVIIVFLLYLMIGTLIAE